MSVLLSIYNIGFIINNLYAIAISHDNFGMDVVIDNRGEAQEDLKNWATDPHCRHLTAG
jgi:hypothetical protein